MKHGRFLSNINDPRKPNARRYFHGSYNAFMDKSGHSAADEWRHHMEWVNANVIDRPKATDTYTVEQLEAMNMVGIYAPAEGAPE